MGLFGRTRDREVSGVDGGRIHVDGKIIAPLSSYVDGGVRMKIVKREGDFAAHRGETVLVGEPIPGLRRWKLSKVERRRDGADVPSSSMMRVTLVRA